jgi:hypothetical protein
VQNGLQMMLNGLPQVGTPGHTGAERSTGAPSSVIIVLGLAAALIAAPVRADERDVARDRFVTEARALMAALRSESRLDAERISAAYGEGASAFAFGDFEELTASARIGLIRPLPLDEYRFNLRPRLTGAHPIGEKDLPHQPAYVASRPATLGLLLHVASRVRSTRLEVTSLVRHEEYQRALQRTNPNARTALPTHAMGLAFDISILNVPIAAGREIRDVLRTMRDEGALFFIAETRQLVFHVVPAPGGAQFYAAVFGGLTAVPAPPWAVPPPAPSLTRAIPAPRDLPLTRSECGIAGLARASRPPLPHAAITLWLLAGATSQRRRRRR